MSTDCQTSMPTNTCEVCGSSIGVDATVTGISGIEVNTPAANVIVEVPESEISEVWDGRRRMSWVALFGMIIPTFYVVLMISNVEIIDKLGTLFSWYYLAMASIVCAYFGFTSWSSIKGK